LRRATLEGALVVVACLAALAWQSSHQRASRQADLDRETRVVASQAASRIRGGLEKQLISLQQMANFWANSEEVTQQEFESFASNTFRLMPLCLRISAIDSTLKIRWVYPPEINRALVGFDVRTHARGYETLLRAKAAAAPVLSAPLSLVGGALGFALTVPIFHRGEFQGAIVGSFRSAGFFGSLFHPEVLASYDEMVLDSATPLSATGGFAASPTPSSAPSERFTLGGRTWEIWVKPRPEVIDRRLSSGQAAFWLLGSILTLVAAGAASARSYWGTGAALRLRSQGAALEETRARLDDANQQLLQADKMAAMGGLVAGVAQEVNNPLASIMGYTQLALSQNPSPEIRRYLETVCSETERAGRIVRNLLTFARRQPPEKRLLGLNGILEKTLEIKFHSFKTNGIEVSQDLDPDLPLTMIDFQQMQQVLLNLLNNAEQAMLETGRGGKLHVGTRRVGDRIEARVADSGPGIPVAIRNRIFEPFFTTKKEGSGTGLGLSLCYGILQEHGGSIRAESGSGPGTTFVLDLPIVRGEEKSPQPEAELSAAPGRLRVLVVDDEPSLQGFLVELLGSMGHSADTASDVPEALRKISANGHDLVITDMKMPRGTGKDVYRAVLEKSPRLARRVIFTTGDGEAGETRQFFQETGNEILLKPWKIEEIERAIAKAMKN
jgi:signal transduction histidine kinase/CheY-like chemotaxis protein